MTAPRSTRNERNFSCKENLAGRKTEREFHDVRGARDMSRRLAEKFPLKILITLLGTKK
jgi:hypothetical protein